jgi:hypothetical protein
MQNKDFRNSQKGYVALISAIIISFVMSGLAVSANLAAFWARSNSLYREYKMISKNRAEACADSALLSIAQDQDYRGDESITASGCRILPVIYDPATGYGADGKKTAQIITQANYPEQNGAFSRIEIKAEVNDPSYSPPSAPIHPQETIAILSRREK